MEPAEKQIQLSLLLVDDDLELCGMMTEFFAEAVSLSLAVDSKNPDHYCRSSERQGHPMLTLDRRGFLAGSTTLAAMASISASAFANLETIEREAGVKLKLGLNACSFNKQLREDTLTLADTVHFCAKQGVVVAVQQHNDFLKTASETETRNRRSE